MKRFSPYTAGIIVWILLVVGSFGVLAWQIAAPWLALLLVALNLATFFIYGLDKLLATQRANRVPEYVLYFTAFAGGAIGALLAMKLFRHKTSKVSFQFTLAFVVLLELIIFLLILRPELLTDLISVKKEVLP